MAATHPNNPNPFLIPDIIQNIIRKSSFSSSDYQSFRLVSPEWNQEATHEWVLEAVIFSNAARLERGLLLLTNPLSTMPTIRILVLTAEFFAPKQPYVVPEDFAINFGRFMGLVAGELTNMTMMVCEGCRLTFKEDHFLDLTQLPKLTDLALTMHCGEAGFSGSFFLDMSRKLLSKTSVLNKLCLLWSDMEPKTVARRIGLLRRTAFGEKVWRSVPTTVTSLGFLGTFSYFDYTVFRSLPLPRLTHLDMQLKISSLSGEKIYHLLENKRTTIVDLSLLIYQTEENILGFRLPVFPEVVELSLKLWSVELRTPEQGPVPGFGILFPKVRVVVLSFPFQPLEPVFNYLFPAGFHAPEVHTFKWGQLLRLNEDQLFTLNTGFTFLRKLAIGAVYITLDNLYGFPLIFQGCTQLEEFSFKIQVGPKCNSKLDSIFTGIPQPKVVQIRKSQNWTRIDLLKVKTSPGISDLKNLRVLSLLSSTPMDPKITDITGVFGLMKLPNLEKLRISEFRMSEVFLEQLKTHLGEANVTVVQEAQ